MNIVAFKTLFSISHSGYKRICFPAIGDYFMQVDTLTYEA